MFIGAQVSLYPMTSDFIDVITTGLAALSEPLINALRDLFAAAAKRPEHVTMHVTLSRGCPGEPDDPTCRCEVLERAQDESLADRQTFAAQAVSTAPVLGVGIDVQFSLYVMGDGDHMEEIYGCIDFLKSSGTFFKSKNFCTRLRGDAGAVFETLRQAFLRFGPAQGHVTIDLTASANSPSLA